jgi:hypothetical protein
VSVTELEARRTTISSEEERRVRNLEREGSSAAEAWASVIGYPEACTDGGKRIGDA